MIHEENPNGDSPFAFFWAKCESFALNSFVVVQNLQSSVWLKKVQVVIFNPHGDSFGFLLTSKGNFIFVNGDPVRFSAKFDEIIFSLYLFQVIHLCLVNRTVAITLLNHFFLTQPYMGYTQNCKHVEKTHSLDDD